MSAIMFENNQNKGKDDFALQGCHQTIFHFLVFILLLFYF